MSNCSCSLIKVLENRGQPRHGRGHFLPKAWAPRGRPIFSFPRPCPDGEPRGKPTPEDPVARKLKKVKSPFAYLHQRRIVYPCRLFSNVPRQATQERRRAALLSEIYVVYWNQFN
ncbi:hypothetical protein CEXT_504391 [Caerostris extrusa]|uniref:Uncharacterized protein n=1 Tax=Caerostris extrusa TaxID=172846 RepID=A0AAV4TJH1_CAEEX|nr:hypothetical protein CEXT_504391 [Caerostris extrusa]